MRLLTRLKLDPARLELITGFFETYLELNKQEEEQLNQELGKINQKEAELIMQVTTSWHEKGKIEDICKFMVRRFSADYDEVIEKVRPVASLSADTASLEILDGIIEELFAANTLEEAQAIIRKAVDKSLQ